MLLRSLTPFICNKTRLFLSVLMLGTALWSAVAEAIIFNLNNRANPRLSIRVGAGGNNISEVSFSVPAAQLGDNTTITGTPSIRIRIQIRASGANPLTASLTADSLTNPLTNNDPGSNSTIPFSEISWTARDGDIPSGVFTESVNQPIVNFQSSQRYVDFHAFSYANSLGIEAGTYEGRVTYTFAAP